MQDLNTEHEQVFPPTPEQIDKFIEDCDNGEWEKVSWTEFKAQLDELRDA